MARGNGVGGRGVCLLAEVGVGTAARPVVGAVVGNGPNRYPRIIHQHASAGIRIDRHPSRAPQCGLGTMWVEVG